jgi:hypothetical protein
VVAVVAVAPERGRARWGGFPLRGPEPGPLPPALEPGWVPGPALGERLEELELLDLDAYALVEAVAAWTAMTSWAQARAAEAAAVLAMVLGSVVDADTRPPRSSDSPR